MFERYTEKARRVIFFARYEASQFGSPYIETEHLLLGLLREAKDHPCTPHELLLIKSYAASLKSVILSLESLETIKKSKDTQTPTDR